MDKQVANEAGLIEASINGNSAAFESIVRKYQGLVCAITYSSTGNVQKSEELAQETFVRAWKNLKQLKDLGSFKAWLCSIANITVKNHFRSQKRDLLRRADSIDNAEGVACDTAGPAENLVSKEEQTVVARALENIPESYRQPLILFYRQGQSVKEVAEQLDLSEENVRTRLSRGRKMLKEQVTSVVENTLSRTAPGKAFTACVMASVAGIVLKGTGAAAAAAVTTGGGSGAATTGTGIGAVLSTAGGKIVTAAALLVIGIGAVVVYTTMNNADTPETVIGRQEVTPDGLSPAIAIDNTKEITVANQQPEITEKQPETPGESVAVAKATSNEKPTLEEVSPVLDFQAKGVLSGLITDIETGEPVADAEVVLVKGAYTQTKTDEKGFYSFETIKEEGNYRVGIYSKDYVGITEQDKQPQVFLKKDEQYVKHLQLPKACMVDVYVVDEDGIAIADAGLWVTSLAEEHGRIIESSKGPYSTDENGYCLLGGIAAAKTQYLITAVHYKGGKWIKEKNRKYREQIREYAPGYSKLTLEEPEVIENCRIVLKKGHTVRGVAKYTDGTAAKECKIVPRPDWWHSLYSAPGYPIDPNGSFILSHVTEGTYDIAVSIPLGTGSSSSVPTVFTMKLPLKDGKLLEVTVPGKPTEVSSSGRVIKDSDPKPKLYGVVTDEMTGEPVKDFRIRYKQLGTSYYPSAERWGPFSNAGGEFMIDVVGGEHISCEIQVVADGYASKWSERIDTVNNHAVSIKLSRGGSIAGVVVDGKGRAVENAKVLPYSVAGSIRTVWPPVFGSEDGAVTTDKNGRFILKNLAAGVEYLKVVHPDYPALVSSEIGVAAGGQKDIGKVVLENGGTVEGFVYDEQGKAAGGVTLYAKNHYMYSSSDILYGTAMTDPNGFYSMKNLPEELCYITQVNGYRKTGVVSRGIVPANNKTMRLDFGA